MEKSRIVWVDNTKIFAIFLVALGHMIMGLRDAGIFTAQNYPGGFITFIYTFHVPLFFICSGFIYQQFTKMETFKDYGKNMLKKLIALGIPYFVFAGITFLLKSVFASSVNHGYSGGIAGLIKMYFFDVTAPYWFLYALFLIFAIAPVFKRKGVAIAGIALSVGLYFVYRTFGFGFLPRFLGEIFSLIADNLLWFLIGMAISFFSLTKLFKPWGIAFFALAAALFTAAVLLKINFTGLGLIIGILACAGCVGFIGAVFNKENKVTSTLSKYVMPVFLMHTIFAAGVRTVLIKIGIMNLPVHLAAGLIASFALPIAAAFVMEKIKLDFLYQPTKYIKIK